VCYLISKAYAERSAFLAVVGAIGDKQDTGPRRILTGMNSKILESYGESSNGIESKYDLLFWARETKPIHESISNTLTVYIPGLTGNKDACLASLRSAGIDLRAGSRWKTISELGEDEKRKLLEAIVPHLSGTTYTVEDLVGNVYSLNSKDEYSMIRDARDFATLLSVCGRSAKAGAALSLSLGDEQSLAMEAEQILSEYRTELVKSVQFLLSSEDRISERGDYALIVGDGIVGERMTGAVCQILSSYSRFKQKVVFVRTTTQDGDVKISARRGKDRTGYDLGSLVAKVAIETRGVGGGHRDAAGARFSIAKQQEFQQVVDGLFQSRRNG